MNYAKLRRTAAFGLTAVMLTQALPLVSMAVSAEEAAADEALRNSLLEQAEKYPDGAFGFLAETEDAAENSGFVAVDVVRYGSTDEEASVEVRSMDVTAAYGKDYRIYEAEGWSKDYAAYTGEGVPVAQLVYEQNDIADTQAAEQAEMEAEKEQSGISSLAAAYEEQTGQAAPKTNWRGEFEEYEMRKEAVSALDNDLINAVDGASLTLTFAPGEYKKTVYVELIDDKLSESDESAALLLGNASAGEMAEIMQHTVNIKDNEETEEIVFAMRDANIRVDGNAQVAEVTVDRLSGLEYYAAASVQTAPETAASGTDYIPQDNVSLMFAPGEASKTVTIPLPEGHAQGVSFRVSLNADACHAEEGRTSTLVSIDTLDTVDTLLSTIPSDGGSAPISIGSEYDTQIADGDGSLKEGSYTYSWGRISGTSDGSFGKSGQQYTGYKLYNINGFDRWGDSVIRDSTWWTTSNLDKLKYARWIWAKTETWGETVYRVPVIGSVIDTCRGKNISLYIGNSCTIHHSTDSYSGTWTDYKPVSKSDADSTNIKLEINTDGANQKGGVRLLELWTYIPTYTLRLKNAKAPLKGYEYTASGVKADEKGYDVVPLSGSERWSTYTGIKPGSSTVSVDPGSLTQGVRIKCYNFYAGSRLIGTTTSADVDYDTLHNMRSSAANETALDDSLHVVDVVPVYEPIGASVVFESEDKSALDFQSYKLGESNAVTLTQIDRLTFTAKNATNQNIEIKGVSVDTSVPTVGEPARLTPIPSTADLLKTVEGLYTRDPLTGKIILGRSVLTSYASTSGSMILGDAPASAQGDEQTGLLFGAAEDGRVNMSNRGIFFTPNNDAEKLTMKRTFEVDNAKTYVKVFYNDPTFTVKHDPAEIKYDADGTIRTPNDSTISIANANDPDNPIGFSDRDNPFTISPFNDVSTLSGYYLLNTMMPDEKLHYINEDGDWVTNKTKWTYTDNENVRHTVTGSTIIWQPYFNKSEIKYFLKAEPDDVTQTGVDGKVYVKEKALFSKNTYIREVPAVGARVQISGFQSTVGNDGSYHIDPHYDKGEIINAFVTFDSLRKTFPVATTIDTEQSFTLEVDRDDALRVISTSMTADELDDSDNIVAKTSDNIVLRDTTYHLNLSAKGDAGINPGFAEFRFYDKYGVLKSELTQRVDFPSNSNDITLDLNPMKMPGGGALAVGDSMTVKLYDTKGNGYFEHHTDIIVAENPSGGLSVDYDGALASESTPLNTFFNLIGKAGKLIGTDYSYGWEQKADKASKRKNTGELITTFNDGENQHILAAFGYDPSWSAGKSKSSDGEDLIKLKNTLHEDIDNMNNGEYKPSKDERLGTFGNSAWQFNIKALALLDILVETKDDAHKGELMFNDFFLLADANASYGKEIDIPNPYVDLKVSLKFTLGAAKVGESGASGAGIRWHFFPKEGDTPYFTSFHNASNNLQLLEQTTIQNEGDIALNAGVSGQVEVSKFGITLSGGIAVNFNNHVIYNSESGWSDQGQVILSPSVAVEVLGKNFELWSDDFDFPWGNQKSFTAKDEEKLTQAVEQTFDESEMLYMPTTGGTQDDYAYVTENWGGSSYTHGRTEGVTETLLKDGYAANGDIHVQDLGGGRYLAIFLDAVQGRANEDKLGAFYSIYDGAGWSEPVILEDDGTLDYMPTICEAGSKGYLLVWSDADQSLAGVENIGDRMSSLNLTGRFFDPATGTMGDVMAITQNTDEDYYADTNPQITFDEEDGVQRLKIYYTKSDYEVTDDAQGEVLGDILNPTQFIVTREYDFANDTWSSDFTGSSRDAVLNEVGEAGYETYRKNWYGQVFLALAPTVKIEETLDESGYWAEGTTAQITEQPDTESVVKESAAIGYNHLSLLAYVLDNGGASAQTEDQGIYLQIYNAKDDEYHHPIKLSGAGAEFSNLQFVREIDHGGEESTYLYYIEDGAIRRMNISHIVSQSLLEGTTSAGNHYYYVNKAKNGDVSDYEPPVWLVRTGMETEEAEAEETEAIVDDGKPVQSMVTHFRVKNSGDYHYLVWSQTTSVGEPTDHTYEYQLYASRELAESGEKTLAVQLTDREKQKIDEFDYAIEENGDLTVLASRQTFDDQNQSADDTTQLVSLRVEQVKRGEIGEITEDEIQRNEDNALIQELLVDAKNTGLPMFGSYAVEVLDAGGRVVYTTADDLGNHTLDGGTSASQKVEVPLDENYRFNGTVRLIDDGAVLAEKAVEVKAKPSLAVNALRAQVPYRDQVLLGGTIRNTSILDSGEVHLVYGVVDAEGNRTQLGSDAFTLDAEQENDFIIPVEYDFDKLDSVKNADGSLTDSVDFYVDVEGDVNFNTETTTLSLNATPAEAELMTGLTDYTAAPMDYAEGDDKLSLKQMAVGDVAGLNLMIGDKIAENEMEYVGRTKLIWEPVDNDVISVTANGAVTAKGVGETVVKGYVVPSDRHAYAFADGTYGVEDNYAVKPSAVIRPITATIVTVEKANEDTPADTPQTTTDDQKNNGSVNVATPSGGSSSSSRTTSSGGSTSRTNASTTSTKDSTSPKTGENTLFSLLMALLAGSAVTGAAARRRKGGKKDEGRKDE